MTLTKAKNTKRPPFEYMKSPLVFFDEGAEIAGEDIDLMGFSYSEDCAFGMVDNIAQFARRVLGDVKPAAVRAVLQFADMTLDTVLENRLKVVADGTLAKREDLDFTRLNQIDFIHVVIDILGMHNVVLLSDDSADADRIEVTSANLCAAYALRMLYNATRPYLHESELREYYLMQAATAYGLMQSLVPRTASPAAETVQAALRKAMAKSGAAAMLAKDSHGKHAAMEDIKEEFKRWQEHSVRYESDSAFAKAMHTKHADVIKNEVSIKNACTRWRKKHKSSS